MGTTFHHATMKQSQISNSAALIACLCIDLAANRPAGKSVREKNVEPPNFESTIKGSCASYIHDMHEKRTDFACLGSERDSLRFESTPDVAYDAARDTSDAPSDAAYFENLEASDWEWEDWDADWYGWDDVTSSLHSEKKAQRRKEAEWDGAGRQHASRTSSRRQAW